MSKYLQFETTFRDGKYLCAALESMGLKYESHEQPQSLVNYESEARSAHIIVRKQSAGSLSDIGFLKQADGTYQAIVSDYDGHIANLGRLKQLYSVARTNAVCRAKGYVMTSHKEADGRIKLRFTGR